MRLGLFLSAQHPAGVRPADAVGEHLEQVAVAREMGFSSVWAGQHFLSNPFQMFQTVPFLARMAAEAGDMTIGPGIMLLTLLNPVEVAENAATLSAISGGRYVLGVGLGYRAVENAAFGVGGARGELFETKLDVVRRLLAGEAVTAVGTGFALDGARLGLLPDPPPPVWIAANSDRAVRRAARLGDAWLINPHTALGELERQVALYRDERAAAGLPPAAEMPIIKEVCVAETDAAALAAARPYLQGKYEAYVDWGQSEVMPAGDTLRREWQELTGGGRFILGSPATCAAQLREHADRLGTDHVICRVQWPGMPQTDVLRTLRLLAGEVQPRLAAA
jgi:alkanesulfonate monooxygenase SsuD/methylene tetrahydromethanopterin reductase-like flavin-dependent oxidoreductase (luciferase family)